MFEPKHAVQILCNGHTVVAYDSVQFTYEDGEATVTINFTQKNAAAETCAQPAWWMTFKNLTPDMIEVADIICGGDHRKGTSVAGARICVTLFDNKPAQSLEMLITEVTCQKDTADILSITTKDKLINSLQKMAENYFNISLDEDGGVARRFGGPRTANSLRVEMYGVGDLA